MLPQKYLLTHQLYFFYFYNFVCYLISTIFI
nr:MAG TPA: hypothetical protein [Caudoviricetes sp.]DAV02384.1 MAG TPA: hypothetical protein [Caudoviricetes sp.]